MSSKHESVSGIVWKHADVRNMHQILSASIDVAFDKGTLDAMIYGSPWDPPREVRHNISQYMREVCIRDLVSSQIIITLVSQVFRVLKSDGIFIYVTYRQPHFVKPLLDSDGVGWIIEMETLCGSESSFDYFGFTLRKATEEKKG